MEKYLLNRCISNDRSSIYFRLKHWMIEHRALSTWFFFLWIITRKTLASTSNNNIGINKILFEKTFASTFASTVASTVQKSIHIELEETLEFNEKKILLFSKPRELPDASKNSYLQFHEEKHNHLSWFRWHLHTFILMILFCFLFSKSSFLLFSLTASWIFMKKQFFLKRTHIVINFAAYIRKSFVFIPPIYFNYSHFHFLFGCC